LIRHLFQYIKGFIFLNHKSLELPDELSLEEAVKLSFSSVDGGAKTQGKNTGIL